MQLFRVSEQDWHGEVQVLQIRVLFSEREMALVGQAIRQEVPDNE